MVVKVPYSDSADKSSLEVAPLPIIVHWNQNHFVVVYRISKKFIWVADPASEKHKLQVDEFKRHWLRDGNNGIVLLWNCFKLKINIILLIRYKTTNF